MPLDPNKLTRKSGEALGAAQALARELNHSQVTPEHLLAALVNQPESVVLPVLERIGVPAKYGSSGMVIARQPFATTRLISAVIRSMSQVGPIANGMNRPGYAPHHSSMCQSL